MSSVGNLKQLTAAKRYEEALGLPIDAAQSQVDEARIVLMHVHQADPSTLESISLAATSLKAERGKALARGERYREIGCQLCREGRKAPALPYLTRAAEMCALAIDYHWLGSTLVQMERFHDALAPLMAAIKARGDGIDHLWLGEALRGLKKHHEALPFLTRALELGERMAAPLLLSSQQLAAPPPTVTPPRKSLSARLRGWFTLRSNGATALEDPPMFVDRFSDNRGGWLLLGQGAFRTTLGTEGLTIENSNEGYGNCFVHEDNPASLVLPGDCDIIVVSRWKGGVQTHPYGVSIGLDNRNLNFFALTANGQTMGLSKQADAIADPLAIPYEAGKGHAGDGQTTNTQRFEVRGRTIRYFVNGVFVGGLESRHELVRVGFLVSGQQRVVFEALEIRRIGTPVIFADDFTDNRHGWPAVPKGVLVGHSNLEPGAYVITANSHDQALCVFVFHNFAPALPLPRNFDIEITSIWRKGSMQSLYGVLAGLDAGNGYQFLIRGDGCAVGTSVTKSISAHGAVIPWAADRARKGDGIAANIQRLEVRGGEIRYLVNGNLIGEMKSAIAIKRVGLLAGGQQEVAFTGVRITMA